MSGGNTQSTTSTPVISTLPGATGDTGYGTSTGIFNQANALTNAGPTLNPIKNFGDYGAVQNVGDFSSYGNVDNGVFTKSLQDSLLNPTYGAKNPNESALINSLMDVTSGRGAVSGLGAPTQSALATSIAPTLVDLNDKYIKNLIAGREGDITSRGQDITRNLGIRGQDVGLRGQDIGRNTDLRGQDISINAQNIQQWMGALQSLAELAGLAMPQTTVGANTTTTGTGQSLVQSLLPGGKIGGIRF